MGEIVEALRDHVATRDSRVNHEPMIPRHGRLNLDRAETRPVG